MIYTWIEIVMGLSSNVLWHQTKKPGLMNILKTKKLYFSYCLEDILASEHLKGIAFPMVSLCDLPLSEFGAGKWAYGNYALGFSRKWGVEKGFNPVCYCLRDSEFFTNQIDNLGKAFDSGNVDLIEKAIYPFSYMKFVEGPLLKKRYENYRFYDEKEIRLVPTIEGIGDYPYFLDDINYEKYKNKNNGSSVLGTHGVPFEYTDLKYVIVESEQNRIEVQRFFQRQNVDFSHIVILIKSQILEDIVGDNHNVELPKIDKPKVNVAQMALQLGRLWQENKRFQ